MIVVPRDGALEIVTQPDHAALAAELLGLWRRDGLPDHPRRGGLLRAAREHDNGWREADAAPTLDRGSGRPYSFVDLPHATRRELWLRGAARHLDDDPHVALLVVEHGRRLHARWRGESDWQTFLERLDELRAELLERVGIGESELADDYRFIELSDSLSLMLSGGWSEPYASHGYRARLVDRETLEVAPLPLAGATTFRLAYRAIERRKWNGDADLAVDLASARWRIRPVRVVPAG
jgi:hypothetical protein